MNEHKPENRVFRDLIMELLKSISYMEQNVLRHDMINSRFMAIFSNLKSWRISRHFVII